MADVFTPSIKDGRTSVFSWSAFPQKGGTWGVDGPHLLTAPLGASVQILTDRMPESADPILTCGPRRYRFGYGPRGGPGDDTTRQTGHTRAFYIRGEGFSEEDGGGLCLWTADGSYGAFEAVLAGSLAEQSVTAIKVGYLSWIAAKVKRDGHWEVIDCPTGASATVYQADRDGRLHFVRKLDGAADTEESGGEVPDRA